LDDGGDDFVPDLNSDDEIFAPPSPPSSRSTSHATNRIRGPLTNTIRGTSVAKKFSGPAIGSYDIAALSPGRYSDHDVNKDNTENFSSLNSFSWADEMDKFTLQARQRSRLVDTRLDLGGV
jgi:hypothetical protein